jgi:hypothetical protein
MKVSLYLLRYCKQEAKKETALASLILYFSQGESIRCIIADWGISHHPGTSKQKTLGFVWTWAPQEREEKVLEEERY